MRANTLFNRHPSTPPPAHVEYYSRKHRETKERAISSRRFVIVEYGGLDAPAGISHGYGLVYGPTGVSFSLGYYDEATAQAVLSLIALANEALGAREGESK